MTRIGGGILARSRGGTLFCEGFHQEPRTGAGQGEVDDEDEDDEALAPLGTGERLVERRAGPIASVARRRLDGSGRRRRRATPDRRDRLDRLGAARRCVTAAFRGWD